MADHRRQTENLAYCRGLVRRHAEDLLIAAQFAPAQHHAAIIAVHAFACEINRIPGSVSEPMLGAIRQQWWRDAIAEIRQDGAVRAHPVVELLVSTLRDREIPETLCDRLDLAIDAISFFLEPNSFETPDQILHLAKRTHGFAAVVVAEILSDGGLPETQAELMMQLEGINAIARILDAGPAATAELAQIETFQARLTRYAQPPDDALPHHLLQVFTATAEAILPVEPRLMPAICQVAVARSRLRSSRQTPQGRRETANLLNRARIFKAVLTGRLL